jgi:hypothetical protein
VEVQGICKHKSSRTIDDLEEEREKGEKADIEKRIDHHLAMKMPKLTDCSITKRRHSGTYIYI